VCTIRLEDGTIQENPARELAQVDKFRAHDYGLIPVERYFDHQGQAPARLHIVPRDAIPLRILFGAIRLRAQMGRARAGPHGAQAERVWDRYHFDDVNFQDETFFTKAERVRALADRIIESGMKITWAAPCAADQGIRLPDEVWMRCKQSGLRRLLVGVESGSNEVLKRIRKDIKIEQVYETAEKMLRFGIAGHFPFIVGFPDETDAHIQATLDCAKRLRSMSADFLTPIFYFKALSGERSRH